MLKPVDGEPIIEDSHGGLWEYVWDSDDGHHKYLHRSCDVVCDREGYCIMCGAPSPTVWVNGTVVVTDGTVVIHSDRHNR